MTHEELKDMIWTFLEQNPKIAQVSAGIHGGFGIIDEDGDRFVITTEEL